MGPGPDARPTFGSVAARDGCRLAVERYDHPSRDRAPAVLVHSLGLDRSVWRAVAERLARHTSVLRYHRVLVPLGRRF